MSDESIRIEKWQGRRQRTDHNPARCRKYLENRYTALPAQPQRRETILRRLQSFLYAKHYNQSAAARQGIHVADMVNASLQVKSVFMQSTSFTVTYSFTADTVDLAIQELCELGYCIPTTNLYVLQLNWQIRDAEDVPVLLQASGNNISETAARLGQTAHVVNTSMLPVKGHYVISMQLDTNKGYRCYQYSSEILHLVITEYRQGLEECRVSLRQTKESIWKISISLCYVEDDRTVWQADHNFLSFRVAARHDWYNDVLQHGGLFELIVETDISDLIEDTQQVITTTLYSDNAEDLLNQALSLGNAADERSFAGETTVLQRHSFALRYFTRQQWTCSEPRHAAITLIRKDMIDLTVSLIDLLETYKILATSGPQSRMNDKAKASVPLREQEQLGLQAQEDYLTGNKHQWSYMAPVEYTPHTASEWAFWHEAEQRFLYITDAGCSWQSSSGSSSELVTFAFPEAAAHFARQRQKNKGYCIVQLQRPGFIIIAQMQEIIADDVNGQAEYVLVEVEEAHTTWLRVEACQPYPLVFASYAAAIKLAARVITFNKREIGMPMEIDPDAPVFDEIIPLYVGVSVIRDGRPRHAPYRVRHPQEPAGPAAALRTITLRELKE